MRAMPNPWLRIFSLALFLLAATAIHSQEDRPLEEVVWQDEAHTRPTLVPGSILARFNWLSPALPEGGPLDPEQAKALRERIRWLLSTSKARAQPPCGPAPVEEIMGPLPGKRTLAELVASAPMAAVARVDRLVPGWSPAWQGVASQVRLTVEQILVDTEDRLREKQPISFLFLLGDFSLGGVRFCREPAPGSLAPKPGDLVVVVGYRDRANAGGLHPIGIFALSGGQVLPGRHLSLRSHEPQSLADLRAELAAAQPRPSER
jgi:hypothetical protein